MQLPLQTFTSLVSNAAAAVQGAATQLLDLTVGSVLRAVLEANASMALWLQWIALLVLRCTRAATSQGADLDSWVADFGVTRLPATASAGVLTFSRFTPQGQAVVPVGATAQSADGSQTFAVTADATNAAWSAGQQGYVIPEPSAASVTPVVTGLSVSVPASAVTLGSAGNVSAGVISLLGTAIPGVDTVTNAAAFASGIDAESDTALRSRFSLFLASRAQGTTIAIQYALQSLQQGLRFNIAENQLPNFTAQPGFFTITLDDGTGNPPASLLGTATAAMNALRPIGSQFIVQPPVIKSASVTMTVTASSATVHAAVATIVQGGIETFINASGLGAPLAWSRLMQVAYDADPRVVNVSNLLLNGATTDLAPPANAALKAGTVTVS